MFHPDVCLFKYNYLKFQHLVLFIVYLLSQKYSLQLHEHVY